MTCSILCWFSNFKFQSSFLWSKVVILVEDNHYVFYLLYYNPFSNKCDVQSKSEEPFSLIYKKISEILCF